MFLLFFFLLFQRRETCSFLVRTRKGRKEAASLRLDRWCNPRVYPVGSQFAYHRGYASHGGTRRTGSECAPKALRLRAQTSQSQLLAARGVVACASTATPFEPWVCASQQKNESPRQRLGESFGAFLLSEKSTYLLLCKGENACFSLQKEKHQKNCKPSA